MTDEKDHDPDDRVEQAIDDAKDAAERSAREAAGTLDAMKAAAADAAQRGAAAVSDAADHAKAKLTGAADDVDLDEVLSQTRALAGEWTERLKQAYRDRPGVVIAAAVGALVVTAAIVRAISRR